MRLGPLSEMYTMTPLSTLLLLFYSRSSCIYMLIQNSTKKQIVFVVTRTAAQIVVSSAQRLPKTQNQTNVSLIGLVPLYALVELQRGWCGARAV